MQGRSFIHTSIEKLNNQLLTYEDITQQSYNDSLCLFLAPALYLQENQRLEEGILKIGNSFISRTDGLCPNQFKGVDMNGIAVVQDLLTLNILLCNIDIVDKTVIGKLARLSVQNYKSTVRLWTFNYHISYVSIINAVFQTFHFSKGDTLFIGRFNLEQHLTTSSERVKNVFPGNVYQIRETLFDKPDSCCNKYTE